MGAVVRAIGSIFGGGSTPKANVAPAISEVDQEAERNRRARSALLETAGGTAGAALAPGQTQPGQNVFGN